VQLQEESISASMTARTVPPDRYLRQLRVLGAWWSLGSSAVEPQLLVELSSLDDIDPAHADQASLELAHRA